MNNGNTDDCKATTRALRSRLCVILMRLKWIHQAVNLLWGDKSVTSETPSNCLKRVTPRGPRSRPHTPRQDYTFGLGVPSKCVVTVIYWSSSNRIMFSSRGSIDLRTEREKSLQHAESCGSQGQPCSQQVDSLTAGTDTHVNTITVGSGRCAAEAYLWPAACPQWPHTWGKDAPSVRCNRFHTGWARSWHTDCGHSCRRLGGHREEVKDISKEGFMQINISFMHLMPTKLRGSGLSQKCMKNWRYCKESSWDCNGLYEAFMILT